MRSSVTYLKIVQTNGHDRNGGPSGVDEEKPEEVYPRWSLNDHDLYSSAE